MSRLAQLDDLWNGEDDGLPFRESLNEAKVLELIQQISEHGEMTDDLRKRAEQWIRFNRSANVFEEEPYITWVEQVYSKIVAIIEVKDKATGDE